jgi:hypothetical protein
MRSKTLGITAICVAGITAACRPTTTPSPSPPPEKPQVLGPKELTTQYLRFSPNIYRYHFEQAARITVSGSVDTTPSTITTRAQILVTVAAEPNLDVQVSISFDSITISTQGSIPSPGFTQVTSLDSVLQARFPVAGTSTTVETRLADSLCAYSQFITAARELLLPELPVQIESPGTKVYTDSVSQKACRGGIIVDLTTIRQLRDLSREPPEFTLQQRTEIAGSGQLRRDSMTVSGSILTRGVARFATANRLPSFIQTESEGAITVRLGSLTTAFRQVSHQQIRLIGIGNP